MAEPPSLNTATPKCAPLSSIDRGGSVDLSVVIPALDEGENLATLLPELRGTLDAIGVRAEILVVTRQTDERTSTAAADASAQILIQTRPGYGGALLTAFQRARGRFVLTMDADLSHPPAVLRDMWTQRHTADVLIASRYVSGGSASMPRSRRCLSRVLNAFFRRGLSLHFRDLSSGFRLYRREVLHSTGFEALDFDILQRILVHVFAEGWRIREVPFQYAPRRHGHSHARLIRFGIAYLRTFLTLWKLRNSTLAADYDDRAHDSPIWLQRYWQRQRYKHVVELITGEGPVLDVGCGSSRIVGALPPGSVALDVLIRKLRHARRFGRHLVCASGFKLPLRDRAFSCVLCSQVIEHVPKDSPILDELCRVLAPGGRLVLGTPDYANWQWVWVEKAYAIAAPGGYADEHISHYTRRELVGLFESRGYTCEATRYVLKGELILAFRKPPLASAGRSAHPVAAR